MSLTNLSLTPFLIGLAAIAALLVILQLLRVRYQREDVVTTMFWREAIEESRARVLLKRFRHPWAYLLVFAIAALLWLALAEPQRAASDQTDYVVLLDGSAVMATQAKSENRHTTTGRSRQSGARRSTKRERSTGDDAIGSH